MTFEEEYFMFRKKRLFILLPALLLIPLMLGMMPLNMAHKMAQKGPFTQSHSKQGCDGRICTAHSLISHFHFDAIAVTSTASNQGLPYFQEALCAAPESILPNFHSVSNPLRC